MRRRRWAAGAAVGATGFEPSALCPFLKESLCRLEGLAPDRRNRAFAGVGGKVRWTGQRCL